VSRLKVEPIFSEIGFRCMGGNGFHFILHGRSREEAHGA